MFTPFPTEPPEFSKRKEYVSLRSNCAVVSPGWREACDCAGFPAGLGLVCVYGNYLVGQLRCWPDLTHQSSLFLSTLELWGTPREHCAPSLRVGNGLPQLSLGFFQTAGLPKVMIDELAFSGKG